MRQYKKWVTASMALTIMGALVGCGTSNETTSANSTNATNATNQTISIKDNSVMRFSSGSPSKSWIQGTVTKSDLILKAGTILNISGRLARVQRNPNIQVTLYQSKGADYRENAIELVQKNLPVTGSANFTGTHTVPNFTTPNGSYFTLVFKYKGVPQAFAVLLQK
ncbi:hypothetical protein [Alicyclobacillus mengziensis]|uniref:Lipoprotein n=1 Tax=Alicyclobacillus mengziensis TaxID=2931921 RepID=A0A9X7W0H9_9BACL|nr:hypothetical protein [Alicyclobacillus mengziensis]QSO48446.1 hypothetical protein JZ786_05510 [Alicyclobacillus mengziensis]